MATNGNWTRGVCYDKADPKAGQPIALGDVFYDEYGASFTCYGFQTARSIKDQGWMEKRPLIIVDVDHRGAPLEGMRASGPYYSARPKQPKKRSTPKPSPRASTGACAPGLYFQR
jgi:hypothetical protein